MYNKIFHKILDSSIWLEPTPTRIVWITLLAAMDQDGYAHFSALENLAGRARVTVDEAKAAVECFLAPDENSANPANEGRRIERVPGGYMVLNAHIHRQTVNRIVQREQTRERVAKHRAKSKERYTGVTGVLPRVTPRPYTEAEADTETSTVCKSDTSALTRKKFTKPTLEEVTEYCKIRQNTINPMAFIDHYESNGWKVGKNAMKDWQAAVRTWERHQGVGNGTHQADKRSRAQKVRDKLDDIARRDIEKNGFTNKLD